MSAIPPVTAADPEACSANPVAANLEALKALFPDAFTEDRIDFDVLRQLLGDAIDDGDEKYGLNWSGKRQARRLALTPSLGTLLPAPEDSVDWAATRNLIIEGDNLEVLKLLQKSYAGKVKIIYIDPPYNTGNDFIYADDYADSLGSYLKRTAQVGEDGTRNTSNPESSGRFHTDWLNMMYPRLMLARALLNDDGIIFVSIDDNEFSRLRELLDIVFGPENFIATIIWQKVFSPKNSARHLSVDHDYIIMIAKNADDWRPYLLPRTSEMEARYANPDNDHRGVWTSGDLSARNYYGDGTYPIETPSGRTINGPPPGTYWRVSKARFNDLDADGRIWWGAEGNNAPRLKRFLSEVRDGKTPQTLWFHQDVGNTQESKKELIGLLDFRSADDVFDTPKPTRLIRRMLQLTTNANGADLVLDFFAGSGSTAHGVMLQNAEDGGNRRFILVQVPAPLGEPASLSDGTQLVNLADITKERVRRASSKIKSDSVGTTVDLGYRVYKLAASNLKAWSPGADLAIDLLSAADNLAGGRTEDDLLVELLLKQGVDLTEPTVTRTIAGRTVHAFGGGVLMVCLGDVAATDAEALADGMARWVLDLKPVAPTTIFFKDAGFQNDQAKTNVDAILRQRLDEQLLKVRSV